MTTTFADRQLERFRSVVTDRLGLQIDGRRLGELPQLLARLVEARGAGVEAYLRLIETQATETEIGELAAQLTVPETYFFRNIDQFHALREAALPDCLIRAPLRKLHILSAGCASGEEAYSIAMVARGLWADAANRLSIRAVDTNPVVLRKARRARYSEWALRETPPDARRRWFRADGAEQAIADEVTSLVAFEQRNLVDDDPALWAAGTYDVIFCRNVLMYFSPEKARLVVDRIAGALTAGGYLFLGHAETLRGLSQDFHLRHTHETFYYQRKSRCEALPEPGWTPKAADVRAEAAFDSGAWMETILHSAERIDQLARAVARPVAKAPRGDTSDDIAKAFTLLSNDKFEDALTLIDGLPSARLGDADLLLLRAALLLHSSQTEAAEQACRRLLERDEMSAGAHHVLALCRDAAGDYRGAAEQDQIAIYLDPTFAMPRLHLGLLARRAGDRDVASRELRQALLLLRGEDPARLLLFGGGFTRDALIGLSRAELNACEGGR